MESINLNLIPQGANPVVHAKQFDEGRGFRFNLFNGTAPIVLTGAETITCNVKKPDGNLVTVAVTNTSSNYVEVYTTLQMCACYGANLGEIRLEEDGNDIGMLNFTLSVEESPLNNGIESESSIHNLESMVDEMVAEDVATQYDSANVIFDNEPTDNHGIGYTVTSEGIKTAIDNAFDYDNTASGSLVHITDGADNIPVKSLVSEIVAVESGNGQPKSPTNPYSISGFANGVVSVCGKNLFSYDLTIRNGYWTNDSFVGDNAIVPKENALSWQYIRIYVEGLSSITLSGFDNQGGTNCAWLSSENVNDVISKFNSLNKNGTKMVPSGAKYLCLTIYNINDKSTTYPNAQLEISDTATTYEPYNGNTYTFTFGQTVYGGYFDNKGNLVLTHGIVDLGTLTWAPTDSNGLHNSSEITNMKSANYATDLSGYMCEVATPKLTGGGWASMSEGEFGINQKYLRIKWSTVTSGEDFKALLNGKYFAYLLENPITLAITSQDIPTLLGENNIFSNCGDCEVEYYTYKSNDILEFIDSEIGKKNGTNIPIEENSQDSIKAYVDDEISSTKDYVDNGLSGKADSTDLPFVKYQEIDVTFDASGEGTLFNSVKFVVGLKDIPSDQLYVGYVSYIAGSTIKIKALSRTAIAFSSQNNVSSTRKVGVYYLDNIATQ